MQDEIWKNRAEVYNLIMNKNAHIYTCGDVKMAAGVIETIENILQIEGNISKEKAKDYIKELKVISIFFFVSSSSVFFFFEF